MEGRKVKLQLKVCFPPKRQLTALTQEKLALSVLMTYQVSPMAFEPTRLELIFRSKMCAAPICAPRKDSFVEDGAR